MSVLGAFLFLGICVGLIVIGSMVFDPWKKQ
jgi:hypothetical protein